MERMYFTTRQERIGREDGNVDIIATHNYSIHRANGAHDHNHMTHIDSPSGKLVTSTDHESWYRGPWTGPNDDQLRTFWDKRTPLTVKLRG